MILQNEKEKETLLAAGKRLREVLNAAADHAAVGVTAKDLDTLAQTMIEEGGDTPAFLGYKPGGAPRAFPATLCVSINNQVVHGIPTADMVIKEGDIISIDCGLSRDGLFVDAARTLIIGGTDEAGRNLVEATRKALVNALISARAGAAVGDIGHAVESVAEEWGCITMPEFGGHGIGRSVHEDPFIPNFRNQGRGDILKEGQVVAIEPIFSEGSDPRAKLGKDMFTYYTSDGARAAHFEHTVIITASAPIIVTGEMW